jgi:hypothetical protein
MGRAALLTYVEDSVETAGTKLLSAKSALLFVELRALKDAGARLA